MNTHTHHEHTHTHTHTHHEHVHTHSHHEHTHTHTSLIVPFLYAASAFTERYFGFPLQNELKYKVRCCCCMIRDSLFNLIYFNQSWWQLLGHNMDAQQCDKDENSWTSLQPYISFSHVSRLIFFGHENFCERISECDAVWISDLSWRCEPSSASHSYCVCVCVSVCVCVHQISSLPLNITRSENLRFLILHGTADGELMKENPQTFRQIGCSIMTSYFSPSVSERSFSTHCRASEATVCD